MVAIKRWVTATFILCFLVVIAGGVVRTTQSGMGCPDWPKCFGKWIPPTNVSELPPDFESYLGKQDIDHTFNAFHTWIEYFNRLLGVLLGIFAIIQLFLLFRKKATLYKAFRISCLFLFTVILTGLLGAIVVKLNLAHLSISIHLLLAVVLIQLQLLLLHTIHGGISAIHIHDEHIKKLLSAFLVVVIIQSVFGTMVRIHVDDISKQLAYENREHWLASSPTEFIIHRTFSWIVLLIALLIAWRSRNIFLIRNKVYVLAGIIITSMVTGILLFYADMPAIAQPIHLLLATIAITQVCSILLQVKEVR
ncbi:MAG: COX15/CtaA family protein [Ferruginibacter sp.]